MSTVTRPSWSSASHTPMASRPAPSRATRESRASGGHGTGSGGHSASRATGRGAKGRGARPPPEDGLGGGAARRGQHHLPVLLDPAVGQWPASELGPPQAPPAGPFG